MWATVPTLMRGGRNWKQREKTQHKDNERPKEKPEDKKGESEMTWKEERNKAGPRSSIVTDWGKV